MPYKDKADKRSLDRRRTVRRRRFLKRYAVSCGCKFCGYSDCGEALVFHHINPEDKKFALSNCCNKSFADLKVEVRKCIILCANCHQELHAGYRYGDGSRSGRGATL